MSMQSKATQRNAGESSGQARRRQTHQAIDNEPRVVIRAVTSNLLGCVLWQVVHVNGCLLGRVRVAQRPERACRQVNTFLH